MKKRNYFSWTDEKRTELKARVNELLKVNYTKDKALKRVAEEFGVSASSCLGAYNYTPKRIILNEVNPEDLVPRKTPETQSRSWAPIEVSNKDIRTNNLSIGIHNDLNNECLLLKVNESVTIIKVGEILITLESSK
jgi:hypothetical protein